MVLTKTSYAQPMPHCADKDFPMSHSATVIDLSLFRKRKQAQLLGRQLWAMYAQHAGLAAQQWSQAHAAPKAPRQA